MVNYAGGQLASLACKTPKRVCDFLISIFFFLRVIFVRLVHSIFILFRKSFVNFSQQLRMSKRRQSFLALWFCKEKKVLNQRKNKFALTCSFRKMNSTFAVKKKKNWKIQLFFQKIWHRLITGLIRDYAIIMRRMKGGGGRKKSLARRNITQYPSSQQRQISSDPPPNLPKIMTHPPPTTTFKCSKYT